MIIHDRTSEVNAAGIPDSRQAAQGMPCRSEMIEVLIALFIWR